MRALGVRPSAAALSAVIIRTAAAPSDTCDDVPAVWTPSSRATGFSCASASSEVSRRPSSRSTRWVEPLGLPSSSTSGASMGTTWVPNRSSAQACAASCRLRNPNSSESWRLMPHFSAMRSAPSNCEVNSYWAKYGLGMGTPSPSL